MQLTIKEVSPAKTKAGKDIQYVIDSNGVKYSTFDDLRPYVGKTVEVETSDNTVNGQVYHNLKLPKDKPAPTESVAAPTKDMEVRRAAATLGLEAAVATYQSPNMDQVIGLTTNYETYLRTGEFPR